MKRISIALVTLVFFCVTQNLFAQHSLQLDDGLQHYSVIQSQGLDGLDTYTLPPGGGSILTTGGGGPSLAWLTAGNGLLTDLLNNFLGTTDATPLRIITGGADPAHTRIYLDNLGNISIGQNSATTTAINSQTVAIPNIGSTASSANVLVLNGGNINTSSLNFPTGSGTTNVMTKWTGANTIGNSGLTENYNNSVAPYAANNAAEQQLATGPDTRISLVLTPKGTGALLANLADNTATGGNIRGNNAVDWQTNRGAATQVASATNSVIGGGTSNTASGTNALVGGGSSNTASGANAVVTGGQNNTASNTNSTVSGGLNGTASGIRSTIGGGGGSSIASGLDATVAGGWHNRALGNESAVAGGADNTASGLGSFVGGGTGISPTNNTASGNYSSILGGYTNTAAGDYSAIPGGRSLTLNNIGNFGYNGGANAMTISSNQISTFANTDLWLANNDNSARGLLFYQPQNAAGAFPAAGIFYSGFKASAIAQSDNYAYTWPSTTPAVNKALFVSATSGASPLAVTLNWVTTPSGSGTTNYIPKWTPNGNTLGNSALQDNGSGALTLDNTNNYTLSIAAVAAAAGKSLTINSGNGGGASNGGDLNLNSGSGNVGGNINITSSGAGNASGNINIATGNAAGSNSGGISITTGNTTGAALTPTGNITIQPGTIGGNNGNDNAGSISLISGVNNNSGGGNAGNIAITGSNAASGNGGNVSITAGTGGAANGTIGMTTNGIQRLGIDGTGNTTINTGGGNTTIGTAANTTNLNSGTIGIANIGSAAGTAVLIQSGNNLMKSTNTFPTGSGTTNVMTKWTSSNTIGNSGLTENYNNSVAPYVANNAAEQQLATGADTRISLVLTPKGTGALLANMADNTPAGGNIRGNNAVDWQMSRVAATQVASGNNSVLGGGINNTASGTNATVAGGSGNSTGGQTDAFIGGGTGNNITSTGGAIAGGSGNSAAFFAFVGGGENNIANVSLGTIGGGSGNTLNNLFATIGGGSVNQAGWYSSITGGRANIANGTGAFIGGGGFDGITTSGNTASGNASTIGGGVGNTASGIASVVAGGGETNGNFVSGNTAAGYSSFIGGGYSNQTTNDYSVIGGGENNTSTGVSSFIGGGYQNRANGGYNTIPGGRGLTLSGNFDFGYMAAADNAHALSIAANNVAAFGNVSMWLVNDNGTAGELRYWQPNSTTGAFPPAGEFYTGFKASATAQTDNYAYTWPSTAPAANQALFVTSVAGTNPINTTLTWQTAPTGSGTTNFIPKWTSANALGNSALFDNGATITSTETITPNADLGAALGTSSLRWSSLYVGPSSLHVYANGASDLGGDPNQDWAIGVSTGAGNGNLTIANNGTTRATFSKTGGLNLGTGDINTAGNITLDGSAIRTITMVAGSTHALNINGQANAPGTGGDLDINSGSGQTSGNINIATPAALGGGSISLTAGGGAFGGGSISLSPGGAAIGGSGNLNITMPAPGIAGGGNFVITGLPTTAPSSFLALDASNNVVKSSANVVTGSGTQNTLPKWNNAGGTTLGDSKLSDDGSNVSSGENFLPLTDITYNLGSAAKRWQELYVGPASMHINQIAGDQGGGATAEQFAFGIQKTGAFQITEALGATTPMTLTAAGNANFAGTVTVGSLAASSSTTVVTSNAGTLESRSLNSFAWGLSGNSGTVPGTNFLGTTDNTAFEIHVFDGDAVNKGSKRVMRYEPTATSANILGGYQSNTLTAGVIGATLSGGGDNVDLNRITDNYGTIGGGSGNLAGNNAGTTSDADHATVGGGRYNSATSEAATVGGGWSNNANGNAATIAGGVGNTIGAASSWSAIAGGVGLTINGAQSFGFNAGGSYPNNTIIAANKVAYFGNVDLWLGNNDNSARALYFYAPYNATGAFPNGDKYVGFKAGAVGTSVIWTLPLADATTSGQVLTSNATGTLSWTNGSVFNWSLTGNSGLTDGTNNLLGTTDAIPLRIITGAAGPNTRMLIAAAGDISVSNNFYPMNDNTQSLGLSTNRWANVYIGPASLHIKQIAGDQGGGATAAEYSFGVAKASGNLTVQELIGATTPMTLSSGGNLNIIGGLTSSITAANPTNIGGYFDAQNGTSHNYALQADHGNVYIGLSAGSDVFGVGGGNLSDALTSPFQVNNSGDATANSLNLPNGYSFTASADNLNIGGNGNKVNFNINTDNIAAGAGQFNVFLDNNATALLQATTAAVTVNTSIIPAADNAYNLGSATMRFVNVYATPASFHTYGLAAELDGAIRDWSIGIQTGAGNHGKFKISEATAGTELLIDPTTNAAVFTGGLSASNLSGTNSGDVTLAGQNYLSIAGQVITANPVDLTGTNVTGQLKAASFPILIGDVTTAGGSLSTTIAGHAVTNAKFRQSAAVSIVGNATNAAADVADITSGGNDLVLRADGTNSTLSFGQVATGGIANSAITYAKIQNETNATLLGNNSGAAAAPGEITLGTSLAFTGSALNTVQAITTTSSPTFTGLTLSGLTNQPGIVHNSAAGLLSSGGVATADILASAVTYAKIQNETNATLLGNNSGAAAAPGEITLGTSLAFTGSALNTVQAITTTSSPTFTGLTLSGLTNQPGIVHNSAAGLLSSGGVATADILASAVTYAKIQNETNATLLGNNSGAAAAPGEITLGTSLAFTGSALNTVQAITTTSSPTFAAITATTSVSPTNLVGAGAGKYAEQHTVTAGEAATIAGNSVTINNADIAGATSVVVATFVSAGGGGGATFIKKISTAAGTATITLDAPPVQGDIYNLIIVNP